MLYNVSLYITFTNARHLNWPKADKQEGFSMINIDIQAKEWFDKKYGNSYFSAAVNVDGVNVITIPFEYGYGDHYIDRANQELIKQGFIEGERHSNGVWPSLWRYCEENNIILNTSKQENCYKKELIK